MFEAYDLDTNPQEKLIFTFELSSNVLINFNLKFEKHMLCKALDVLHTEVAPVATATPDGKILYFSFVIWFVSSQLCFLC